MCVYVYIYVYVCVYVYVYVYVCVCIYTYAYVSVVDYSELGFSITHTYALHMHIPICTLTRGHRGIHQLDRVDVDYSYTHTRTHMHSLTHTHPLEWPSWTPWHPSARWGGCRLRSPTAMLRIVGHICETSLLSRHPC
jgi:hypothetical protein